MVTRASPIENILDQLTNPDQPIKPGLWTGLENYGRKWVIGTISMHRRSIVIYANLNTHGQRVGHGWMSLSAFQDWIEHAHATHREPDMTPYKPDLKVVSSST